MAPFVTLEGARPAELLGGAGCGLACPFIRRSEMRRCSVSGEDATQLCGAGDDALGGLLYGLVRSGTRMNSSTFTGGMVCEVSEWIVKRKRNNRRSVRMKEGVVMGRGASVCCG